MRINPLSFLKAYRENLISTNRDVRYGSDNKNIDILIKLGSHRDDAVVLTVEYNYRSDTHLTFRLRRGGWEYRQACEVVSAGLVRHSLGSAVGIFDDDHKMMYYGQLLFLTKFKKPIIDDAGRISKEDIEHLLTRFVLEYSID